MSKFSQTENSSVIKIIPNPILLIGNIPAKRTISNEYKISKNKEYSKSLYIERLNFLDIIGSCLFLDANNPVIKSVNIRKTNVCARGDIGEKNAIKLANSAVPIPEIE